VSGRVRAAASACAAALTAALASTAFAAVLAPAALATPAAAATGPTTGQPPKSAREQFQGRFIGRPAPDFTLSDLRGADLRLSALRGKVVLLNFWYSSCPPCRRETPDLVTLHRIHARQGLEILGINLDDILIPGAGHAPLKAFVDEFKVPYRVLLADNEVFELYGGAPVQPITFLVDRQGKVAKIFWGAYPGSVLEKAIAPYLAPPAGRP
jgi:peroxiredoxin